ncbi:hypothetical protein P0O24_03635 [Methanotrichaceae archaeon M04Ac]|uniref:Uncharacterized protein n=1 Tax=Candidatus Methanocrinis alkalitolerans TaxID=3033395 RepID=A0ABT5XD68_9EURY|nr:hypothetical protein [Candidatus Methanocrinis alkalitolerans]MDF0592670.1 hypothetical protein [Candidatus Methanocrinis alkalitolerans]
MNVLNDYSAAVSNYSYSFVLVNELLASLPFDLAADASDLIWPTALAPSPHALDLRDPPPSLSPKTPIFPFLTPS